MALLNPDDIVLWLDSFVTNACECLEEAPSGRPIDCFVSHNRPPDDCCDYLAVWLERVRPRIGAENAAYITGEKVWRKCGDVTAIADIVVRLVRPCFPTLVDNPSNPFPEASVMDAASKELLVDLQILWCCLQRAACQGGLLPEGMDCLEMFVGDVRPVGPQGGCAGWEFTFGVELEACMWG